MSNHQFDSLPFERKDLRTALSLAPYVLAAVIALVLAVELIWPQAIGLTWQGTVLFLLLAFLIFHDDFKQLDFPVNRESFEDEVQSIRSDVSAAIEMLDRRDRLLSSTYGDAWIDPVGDVSRIRDRLYELLMQNPNLALAKLRLELLDVTRNGLGAGPDHPRAEEVPYLLNTSVIKTAHDVIDLCDDAIKQDTIRPRDGIDIVDLGVDLIRTAKRTRFDVPIRSGEVYWIGMRILVKGKAVESGSIYRLHPVDDGTVGEAISTFTIDTDGDGFVLPTDGLPPGDYVITVDGAPLAFEVGQQTVVDSPIDAAVFSLQRQTFSAEFESGWALTKGEKSTDTLEVTSNREGYPLWASANGTSVDELGRVFGGNDQYLGTATVGDRSFAVIEGGRSMALSVDLTDIEPGEHEFTFAVPDACQSVTADFAVQTF